VVRNGETNRIKGAVNHCQISHVVRTRAPAFVLVGRRGLKPDILEGAFWVGRVDFTPSWRSKLDGASVALVRKRFPPSWVADQGNLFGVARTRWTVILTQNSGAAKR
jgi:hypothetical protein